MSQKLKNSVKKLPKRAFSSLVLFTLLFSTLGFSHGAFHAKFNRTVFSSLIQKSGIKEHSAVMSSKTRSENGIQLVIEESDIEEDATEKELSRTVLFCFVYHDFIKFTAQSKEMAFDWHDAFPAEQPIYLKVCSLKIPC